MDFCPREEAVLEGAAKGSLPAELAEHVAGCAWCAQSVQISECLGGAHELGGGDEEECAIAVPPAGLVYWKAQLRARRDQTEQAMRPARIMESAALAGVLGIGIGAAAYYGNAVAVAAATGFAFAIGITMYVLRLGMK